MAASLPQSCQQHCSSGISVPRGLRDQGKSGAKRCTPGGGESGHRKQANWTYISPDDALTITVEADRCHCEATLDNL